MTDAATRINSLPIWQGAVTWEPLKGGLSNESYVVRDATGPYVVRFGTDYPFHHVIREREVNVARAAYAAGFAPEVVYDTPGVMVSRFIEAATYDEADVQNEIPEIAGMLRDFHVQMARHVSGPGFAFWPFHVIRDYARILETGQHRFAAELPGWVGCAETLEAAQVPLPIVFGHHDLLPANFLHDGTRLWLIDFEYAGFGTAMFDLAGTASNAGFDADQTETLLLAYFGEVTPELRQAHAAMQCASLLREAMWSMVSELHLNAPGVDYVAYTLDNLERFERSLQTYQSAYGALR